MNDLRQAAQQALEALEQCGLDDTHRSYEFEHAARAALRDALAQQEPGGVCGRCGGWVCDPVLAQPLPDPADEYRKGFIDGQIDMRDRPEEQQEQEPVAWTDRELELIDGMIEVQLRHAAQCDAIANRPMAERQKGWDMERVALLRKIKNSPPRREWQSLSEEEIKACLRIPAGRDALTRLEFARAIEAKLKEKNHE